MLTFTQLMISYTIILTIALILISMKQKEIDKPSSTTVDRIENSIKISVILLAISLLLYVGPHLYMLISNAYVYPNPDTYGIIVSIIKKCNWNEAPIDQYYKSFPIYLIEIATLHLVTKLDAHYSLVAIHVTATICMFISIFLITIKNLLKIFSSISSLLYTLTIVNSIYLYSYIGVPIPQSFALYVLLLLIIMLRRIIFNNRGSDKMTFIIISVLSLVHFGVIPIFGLIVISSMFIPIVVDIVLKRRDKMKINTRGSAISYFFKSKGVNMVVIIIIPILLHIIYVFSSCDITKIKQYIDYYIELFNRYVLNIVHSVKTIQYSGLISSANRPLFYINAFAPASFISIALYGFYTIMRKKSISLHVNLMLAHFVIGILLLFIGFIKLYIDVGIIPSVSIARYVNVYGFTLLAIFNVFVLYMILNSNNKLLRKMVAATLVVGLFGALTDPFSVQYRPSLEEAECSKCFATLLDTHNTKELYFTTRQNHYYLSPPLFLWTLVLGDESPTMLYKTHGFRTDNTTIERSLIFNSKIVAYILIAKNFNKPIILIDK